MAAGSPDSISALETEYSTSRARSIMLLLLARTDQGAHKLDRRAIPAGLLAGHRTQGAVSAGRTASPNQCPPRRDASGLCQHVPVGQIDGILYPRLSQIN